MLPSSRRRFLTGLGAPLILGAANKSGTGKPIVGVSEARFEVHHDWGRLPAGLAWGNTHGVCQDSQGRVYVHHTVHKSSARRDTMAVFDQKGRFIRSWGSEFDGGAHGLHIRREGRDEFLYLCDTQRAVVVKTTLKGEEVFRLKYPEQAEPYRGQIKYSPTNVAIAPNGDIYVGDGYGSSYINQYNARGEFGRTFGGLGKEAGRINCPHGLIVDTRGATPVLVVADRGNRRIQRFTLDGRHLDFVDGVKLPCHFHVSKRGEMVVPDLAARVTVLDAGNRVLAHLGEDDGNTWAKLRQEPREKFVAGKFICPHGACFDRDDNLFVVEWVEVGRVSWLRRVS